MRNYLYKRFPESLYPPHDPEQYYSRIVKGLEVARNSSVMITGICRNIEPIIHHSIARLEHTASLFKNCDVLLLENDSTDKTSELIKKYSNEKEWLELIQFEDGQEAFERTREVARAEYLGSLRNQCLDHIDTQKYDYIICIDIDLDGGWSYDGILHSLSYQDIEWSAMTGNGIIYRHVEVDKGQDKIYGAYQRLFFDTWAYRDYGNENPVFSEVVNMYEFDRGEEPVEVFSNFSGIGIYKPQLLNYRYGASENEDGTVNNEHSFIHKLMRDDGHKIYLNPSMIALYSPTEYSLQIQ